MQVFGCVRYRHQQTTASINSRLDGLWVLIGAGLCFLPGDDWLTAMTQEALGIGKVSLWLYIGVALAYCMCWMPLGKVYAPQFEWLRGLIPGIRKSLHRAMLVIAGVLLVLITATVFGQDLHTFKLAAFYAGLAAFLGWVRYGFHVMQNARPIGIRWE